MEDKAWNQLYSKSDNGTRQNIVIFSSVFDAIRQQQKEHLAHQKPASAAHKALLWEPISQVTPEMQATYINTEKRSSWLNLTLLSTTKY